MNRVYPTSDVMTKITRAIAIVAIFHALQGLGQANTVYYGTTSNTLKEKDTSAAEIIAEAAETIEELGDQTYYPPSLLGFIYLPNGPAATNLWVLIPCSSHVVGDHYEWSHYPAIWHNERWKFAFGFLKEE